MRIVTGPRWNCSGIALIIVMIVIIVLGVLAGGFAFSMKVETKLARNTSFEPELEWLGKSGVEFARYVLCQELLVRNEPWDSLNQRWAGGPMGTNEALENISLVDNKLGEGTFSVKIIDLERKFNINVANKDILDRALTLVGANPNDFDTITDSFLDWRDPDDDPHLSGTESAEYLRQPNPGFPPYLAKNGPLDDVSELLMIRGITPALYWGPAGPEARAAGIAPPPGSTLPAGMMTMHPGPGFNGGLVDLFTTLSAGVINPNTASAEVLQLIPGIDEAMAHAIISTRAGPDGMDGTEDDTPFRGPGELINVPGMDRQIVSAIQRFMTTRSVTFEVEVDAQISQYHRRFVAVLRRNGQRDARVLYFHWK